MHEALVRVLIRQSHSHRMSVRERFRDMFDLDLQTELKNSCARSHHALIECLLCNRETYDAECINTAIKVSPTPVPTVTSCTSPQLPCCWVHLFVVISGQQYGGTGSDLRQSQSTNVARYRSNLHSKYDHMSSFIVVPRDCLSLVIVTLSFFAAFDIKIESDIDERIVDKQCQAFLKLIMRVTTCYKINSFLPFCTSFF